MDLNPSSFTPKSPLYWLSGALAFGITIAGLLAMIAPAIGSIMFGMPAATAEALPWIRLAGVRDVALGLILFAMMALKQGRTTGILILLILVIPVTDATSVFLRTGFSYHIFVHGGAAIFMVIIGILLARGK